MFPIDKAPRYINPYTDFGFKLLFGTEVNKEYLLEFLNALLQLEHPIKELNYLNAEQLGDTESDRRSVFDVYCLCDDGSYVIVEMQKAAQAFFKDRCVYYSSFPIRKQGQRGIEWNYRLTAVYTVGILDFCFDNDEQYFHHEVQLVDKTTQKVFYDKLTYVFLEMPKFKKDISECSTYIDKWLFVLKNMTRLLDRPQELQERVFERVFRTAEMAKMTDKELMEYEESLKNYRDWKNVLDTAHDEGLALGHAEGHAKGRAEGLAEGRAKGIAEGRAKGIAEGRAEGLAEGHAKGIVEGRAEGKAEGRAEERLAVAHNLKAMGLSAEQIAKATGLSLEDIEKG